MRGGSIALLHGVGVRGTPTDGHRDKRTAPRWSYTLTALPTLSHTSEKKKRRRRQDTTLPSTPFSHEPTGKLRASGRAALRYTTIVSNVSGTQRHSQPQALTHTLIHTKPHASTLTHKHSLLHTWTQTLPHPHTPFPVAVTSVPVTAVFGPIAPGPVPVPTSLPVSRPVQPRPLSSIPDIPDVTGPVCWRGPTVPGRCLVPVHTAPREVTRPSQHVITRQHKPDRGDQQSDAITPPRTHPPPPQTHTSPKLKHLTRGTGPSQRLQAQSQTSGHHAPPGLAPLQGPRNLHGHGAS